MARQPTLRVRKKLFKGFCLFMIAVGVFLWFLSRRGRATFFVDQILLNIAFPFQKALTVTTKEANRVFDHYFYLVDTRKENDALKHRVASLEGKTVKLKELEKENKRLRKLLDFRQQIKSPLLPAEIIASSPTPWMDTLVIDKGTKDGIHQGMPVISEKGIVGYVFKTTYLVSTVMVVTHYNCRVDAIVQRTRSRGVAGGLLKGRCRIFNVLRSENIEVGDVVVTSGLGSRFPRGLLIGTIQKVERKSYGLFQEAELLPATDFNKLEEVYVLTKPQESMTATRNVFHEKR